MMQLRVVCEPSRTTEVLEYLKGAVGVSNLARHLGAGVDPSGDVIEAVLVREVAQDVMDRLIHDGVSERGEISLRQLDLLESKAAERAKTQVPNSGGDPLVWDELLETTLEDSTLTPTFVAFLVIACLLAAVGVLTDSAATIVGAMVVSPDFGPLAGLAVAAVGRRRKLAIRAGLALGLGYPLAIAVTMLFALLARLLGWLEPGQLDSVGGGVAFVYRVGPYSLVVALLAGIVGMLALTSRKSSVLIGVFISVTTVPAAGYAALAAVVGDWGHCVEALAQLFINLAGVVVASTITLLVRRKQAHEISAHLRRHGLGSRAS